MVKNQDMQFLDPNKTNMSNYHPPDVVGRGSETQLQVGDKLNHLI